MPTVVKIAIVVLATLQVVIGGSSFDASDIAVDDISRHSVVETNVDRRRDAHRVTKCDEKVLDRRVLVEFIGRPGLVTTKDVAVLEQQFLKSYNELTLDECVGGGSRSIEMVSVLESNVGGAFDGRFLAAGSSTRPFTLQYSVQGRCRGCSSGSTLFNQGIRRRNQQVPHEQVDVKDTNTVVSLAKGEQRHHEATTDNRILQKKPFLKLKKKVFKKKRISSSKGYKLKDCKECISPQVEVFANSYNRTIRNITSIDAVTDVTELEEVKCAKERSLFTADVIVDFFGDPEAGTDDQVAALEGGFRDTYNTLNGLNSETCDPLFRGIVSTTAYIDVSPSRRRLEDNDVQGNSNRKLASRTYASRFSVSGQCRSCSRGTRLYNQGVRRSLLVEPPWLEPDRHLQDDNSCYCPVTTPDFRAPTETEFQVSLDQTIDVLIADGLVLQEFVKAVVSVREVDAVECSADISFFQTAVLVKFLGYPDPITPEERQSLELGFTAKYNELAATFCDPFFRTVENATIVNTTRAQADGRSLQQGNRTTVVYQYIVQGRCRGCPSETPLFDEGNRRSLSEAGNHGRRFQGVDECFCATDFVDSRAPTAREFAVEYNETVIALNVTNLAWIEGAESYVLPLISLVPSTAPSSLISPSPSQVPTVGTSLPSQSPSSPVPTIVTSSSNPTANPNVDSFTPSTSHLPSFVPSVGSSLPSVAPSLNPASSSPSLVQSSNPSQPPNVGSFTPSTSNEPSLQPTVGSARPSTAPSSNPSPGSTIVSLSPSVTQSSNPSQPPNVGSFTPSTSNEPSLQPTLGSARPSAAPSSNPSPGSTGGSSAAPSLNPSAGPTFLDSSISLTPSANPSQMPSVGSFSPSISNPPSLVPTVSTSFPSSAPSSNPSAGSSAGPSTASSSTPSTGPSLGSAKPSSVPSPAITPSPGPTVRATSLSPSTQCIVTLPDIECCSADDCTQPNSTRFCVRNRCIIEGKLRFTLLWTGDDDLDLYVTTPMGFNISYITPVDNVTGGVLQVDSVPSDFGSFVESTYFPIFVALSPGNYTYFVDGYKVADTSDNWTLTVYLNGEEVVNHTGSNSSEMFTYNVPPGDASQRIKAANTNPVPVASPVMASASRQEPRLAPVEPYPNIAGFPGVTDIAKPNSLVPSKRPQTSLAYSTGELSGQSISPGERCQDCSPDCKDSLHAFVVDGQRHTCRWLALQPGRKEEHCYPGQVAYIACPETCGKCVVTSSDNIMDRTRQWQSIHVTNL